MESRHQVPNRRELGRQRGVWKRRETRCCEGVLVDLLLPLAGGLAKLVLLICDCAEKSVSRGQSCFSDEDLN